MSSASKLFGTLRVKVSFSTTRLILYIPSCLKSQWELLFHLPVGPHPPHLGLERKSTNLLTTCSEERPGPETEYIRDGTHISFSELFIVFQFLKYLVFIFLYLDRPQQTMKI